MPNTSATGGYLVPSGTQGPPGGLTLTQFIQSVIVGVTGLPGTMVRPRFQTLPPKDPDIQVNWASFFIRSPRADTNAFVASNPDGSSTLNRQESLDVDISFYGAAALDFYSLLRDGLQITQNLEALRLANMGYTDITPGIVGPDLVNERWQSRVATTLTLVRQVVRTYPVLSFASAGGTVNTVLTNNQQYEAAFEAEAPPEEEP